MKRFMFLSIGVLCLAIAMLAYSCSDSSSSKKQVPSTKESETAPVLTNSPYKFDPPESPPSAISEVDTQSFTRNPKDTISSARASAALGLTLRPEQVELLKDMENQGFLLLEPDANRAYIAPGIWLSMDAKLKEDFAASIALYCANHKGTNLIWAEIFDKMSGKKLARWSQVYGFKVY
jgi:hypothetical protein